MRVKNDFRLCFGPTDANGFFTLSREALVKAAVQEKNMFMMDYMDPEIDRKDHLVIEPMDLCAVIRAQKAFAQFKDFLSYPPAYEQGLSAYLGQLKSFHKGRLSARSLGKTEEPVHGSDVVF